MQDIIELERRIAAAFDRIDRGLETADRARATVIAPETAGETAKMSAMARALETARTSSADWAARYSALEAQSADETLALANQIAQLSDELSTRTQELDAALQVVTNQTSAQQDSEIQVLEDQMSDLHRQLSEQSLELATLRAQRASEVEELKAIVAALTPLIEEAQSNA